MYRPRWLQTLFHFSAFTVFKKSVVKSRISSFGGAPFEILTRIRRTKVTESPAIPNKLIAMSKRKDPETSSNPNADFSDFLMGKHITYFPQTEELTCLCFAHFVIRVMCVV